MFAACVHVASWCFKVLEQTVQYPQHACIACHCIMTVNRLRICRFACLMQRSRSQKHCCSLTALLPECKEGCATWDALTLVGFTAGTWLSACASVWCATGWDHGRATFFCSSMYCQALLGTYVYSLLCLPAQVIHQHLYIVSSKCNACSRSPGFFIRMLERVLLKSSMSRTPWRTAVFFISTMLNCNKQQSIVRMASSSIQRGEVSTQHQSSSCIVQTMSNVPCLRHLACRYCWHVSSGCGWGQGCF